MILMPNRAPVFTLPFNETGFLKKGVGATYQPTRDDRIIHEILQLKKTSGIKNISFTFVSEDKAAKGYAMDHGIPVEPFKHERIADLRSVYKGWVNVPVDVALLTKLRNRSTNIQQYEFNRFGNLGNLTDELHMNQFVIFSHLGAEPAQYMVQRAGSHQQKAYLKNLDNLQVFLTYLRQQPTLLDYLHSHRDPESKRDHFDAASVKKVVYDRTKGKQKKQLRSKAKPLLEKLDALTTDEEHDIIRQLFDLVNKNELIPAYNAWVQMKGVYLPFDKSIQPRELQNLQLELLMNQAVGIVSVEGEAGSGKTMMAAYAGMVQIQMGRYDGIMYIRPNVSIGQDIGYLPGTEAEKTEPWERPFKENLHTIFGGGRRDLPKEYEGMISKQIQGLRDTGVIETLTPAHTGGRDRKNRFIIIDEAQYMTRAALKQVMTRAGIGSKVVVLGDRKQINAAPRELTLNQWNSGFVHLVERFPGEPIYGHVNLGEGFSLRSEISRTVSRKW